MMPVRGNSCETEVWSAVMKGVFESQELNTCGEIPALQVETHLELWVK